MKSLPFNIVILSLITLVLYIFSAIHIVNENATNTCMMTYLYEYPKYIPIEVQYMHNVSHRRYSLFAYAEGKYVQKAMSMKFNGVPVLFVPGNGGSHKQVRSLGSVTHHRTWDLQSIFHFDFFAIDYKGELSALYGGTLKDQQEFLLDSVNTILNLYPKKGGPSSVVIVGHSMGGVIAQSLFLNEDFNSSFVNLIITLATPYKPVILLDKNLKQFYEHVNSFWESEKKKKRNKLENLTLISIGGGYKDVLVRPGLTHTKFADLNVLTNAIPKVITSTDHLSIVWCRSLLGSLSRALYDSVDFDVRGITVDRKDLIRIFRFHLIHCSSGTFYSEEVHRDQIKFTKNSKWTEVKKNQSSLILTHREDVKNEEVHLLFDKWAFKKNYDTIMIEVINVEKREWIAECNKKFDDGHFYCDEGENLSKYGTIGFENQKYFRQKFASEKVFHDYLRYIVVRLPARNEQDRKQIIGARVDIYREESRTLTVDLDFVSFWKRIKVLESTRSKALFYRIHLNNLLNMWKVYHFHLIPLKCKKHNNIAYAVFKTPRNHDDSSARITTDKAEVLKLMLLNLPHTWESDKSPYVDLYLSRACTYSVEIEASYLDSLGTVAMRYSFALLAYIAVWLLLVFNHQYKYLAKKKMCPTFIVSIRRIKTPYLLFVIVNCFSHLWRRLNYDKSTFKLDTQLLTEDSADEIVVPIILFLVSHALLYIAGICLYLMMKFNVYFYRIKKIRSFFESVAAYDEKIPLLFTLSLVPTLVTISWFTTGGHCYIIVSLIYYFFICKDYNKCLDIVNSDLDYEDYDSDDSEDDNPHFTKTSLIRFNHTMLLLWLLCVIVYLPTSITWNEWNRELWRFIYIEDTNLLFALVGCFSLMYLWLSNSNRITNFHYRFVTYPIYCISCIVLLTCQVNIYRLPVFLTPVFLLAAIHRYIGLILLKFKVN